MSKDTNKMQQGAAEYREKVKNGAILPIIEELTRLIDSLLGEIWHIQNANKDRVEFSRKEIGQHCYKFLLSLVDEYEELRTDNKELEIDLHKLIEDAHQAGQSNAGVDPSYSEALNYRIEILNKEEEL